MSDKEDLTFHIDPTLKKAIDEVLDPGETLMEFVESALSGAAKRRRVRRDFIRRAMASGAKARETGSYTASEKVLSNLEAILKKSSS